MASSPGAPRRTVALFSADQVLRSRLAERMQSLGRYTISEDVPDGLFLGGKRKDEPDIIVLDVGNGALLDDPRLWPAVARLEGRQLLVLSEPLPPEGARNIVRLKASDWLQAPFSDDDFIASLVRVEGALAGTTSRVLAFVGASGGVGTTTIALAAGHYLASQRGAGAVGVVDLDFQSADCSSFLNLSRSFDLDALLANPQRLDTELLDVIKLERKPNMAIYSFERGDLFFAPQAVPFVLRLLDQVALKHRDVLIDMPNLATPWFEDVARSSDKVFAVMESNVPSLRHGRLLLQRLRTLRDPDTILPIINKTALRLFGNPVGRGDIAKMLGTNAFLTVSRDDGLSTDALNRALIPAEIAPGAKMSKQIAQIFRKALG